MIAHRNVIANIMQIRWHEEVGRKAKGIETHTQIGLLPLSHIYGLVAVANAGIYRGDGVIVLPRFELKTLLECIQKYKINMMHIVRKKGLSHSYLLPFSLYAAKNKTPFKSEKEAKIWLTNITTSRSRPS